MESLTVRSSSTTSEWPPLPECAESPALVLFSGGSDSSLTASLFADRHSVVHLITYSHQAMWFDDRCLNALEYLKKAHGEAKFRHSFLNISDLMGKIFFRPLPQDFREYGTYALPMCCGSCKLSMHVRSILYAREHGIRFAADGSNVELSELFPEQMVPVLDLYRKLYARYGIEYTNPVFEIDRSDHRLFERGVTPKRDYKTEHVVYSNQHSCTAGVMLYGYTLAVGLPLLGRSADKEKAERYIAAKIEAFCIPFLDEALAAWRA